MNIKILLLMFLVLALFAACSDDSTTEPRVNKFSAVETVMVDVSSQARTGLNLAGINGEVTITGVAGGGPISITAIKKVKSHTQADANTGLALLSVAADSTGSDVGVRTVHPANPAGRNYEVNYTVSLPDILPVGVANVNGKVTLQSILADVTVQLANGGIVLDDITGSASIDLANGTIFASVTLPPAGQIDFDLANGEIDLFIPVLTSATFAANAVNGSITVIGLTLTDVTQTVGSLTGTLGGGDGSISLDVGNGTIEVEGI
jgi:DUF4097 and DUF4098 domain-containing protein YvlB